MTTTEQEKFTEEALLALVRRKLKITQLAKTLRPKRHRNTVSQAIHHPGYFPRVRVQIAKALGIKLS